MQVKISIASAATTAQTLLNNAKVNWLRKTFKKIKEPHLGQKKATFKSR